MTWAFYLGLGASLYGALSVLAVAQRHPGRLLVVALLAAIFPGMLSALWSQGEGMPPTVAGLLVSTQYFPGPLIWLYFASVLWPEPTGQVNGQRRILLPLRYQLHLLLPILLLASAASEALIAGGPNSLWNDNTGVRPVLLAGAPALLLLYCVALLIKMWKEPSRVVDRNLQAWVAAFIALLSAIMTTILLGILVWRPLVIPGNAAAALMLFVFGFLILRFPVLLGLRIQNQHAKTGPALDLDLKDQLIGLMQNERLFLEEDLLRNDLAIRLGISEKELSAFLNQPPHSGFLNFVNGYRIEEARRLLEGDSNRSILDITYACGFNSRSSFYEAFRREMGMSPGQYRRNLSGFRQADDNKPEKR